MKQTFGAVLFGLGMLVFVTAALHAAKAPNFGYLVGTFLPGLFFLICGAALRRDRSLSPPSFDENLPGANASAEGARAKQFKSWAELGIIGGIVVMFMGSAIAQQGPRFFAIGAVTSCAGWSGLILGCVNFMRLKGYSGWLGLLGYLLLPGVIVLAFFPNRRKRILQCRRSVEMDKIDSLINEDKRPSYRFLLTLVPLGLLAISLGSLLLSIQSTIASGEWQQVAPDGVGFQALMPGTPRRETKTQDAPAGKVELNKFIVEPKNKSESFMIVTLQFPSEVSAELGGREELLELGRQDFLAASEGQIQSERELRLDGYPGIELEVLPPKGAIVKGRVFATNSGIYQVSAHVPKARVTSDDVRKFLESFKLLAD